MTWYLEAPERTTIRAASPNGRFFVAKGEKKVYRVREGEKEWTLLPAPGDNGNVLVSDSGTVLSLASRPVGENQVFEWYVSPKSGVSRRLPTVTLGGPQEFLEGSEDWIGRYGSRREKIGIFDLSGKLKQPLVSPVGDLFEGDIWEEFLLLNGDKFRHRGHWRFHPLDPGKSRFFVRTGTTFTERKVSSVEDTTRVVSYDGRVESLHFFHFRYTFKDGKLIETFLQNQPATTGAFASPEDTVNRFDLKRPKEETIRQDVITGFDLTGKRRIGYLADATGSQGYVQQGGSRYYASDLGIYKKVGPEDVSAFEYISEDGRRIAGGHKDRKATFVFAIDR